MKQTVAAADPILKKHFGLANFRRGQREIINSVLAGDDALAVLPTGGGKSLCYQYPSIVKKQLVLVISPLIALMNDQVASLKRMGIPAGCLHSGLTQDEKKQVFKDVQRGGPFVLYISPERTQMPGFKAWVEKFSIGLFAIDEAHCVSQWGHDFRADYSLLKMLKQVRPDVPILALTASATPFVLNDIAKQLGLKNPVRHVHGFYRPNLYYSVETCSDDGDKRRTVRQALRQFPEGRILIYCGTRRATEDLSSSLTREFKSIGYYHAGLSSEERTKAQEGFASGKTRILVATNAFGMGIDQPDVRLVVHYQMPANIDSLYQEMGRAGRDGKDSTCLLLYSKKDKGLQSFFITNSKAAPGIQTSRWRALDNLVDYSEGGECRHSEILTYYQDAHRIERCGHCDSCEPTSDRRVIKPVTEDKKSAIKKPRHTRTSSANETIVMSPEDDRIYEILRMWRKEKANELDVPAFVIFSDRTLRHMAHFRPRQKDDFHEIYGLGDAKIDRFAEELLAGPLAPQ